MWRQQQQQPIMLSIPREHIVRPTAALSVSGGLITWYYLLVVLERTIRFCFLALSSISWKVRWHSLFNTWLCLSFFAFFQTFYFIFCNECVTYFIQEKKLPIWFPCTRYICTSMYRYQVCTKYAVCLRIRTVSSTRMLVDCCCCDVAILNFNRFFYPTTSDRQYTQCPFRSFILR